MEQGRPSLNKSIYLSVRLSILLLLILCNACVRSEPSLTPSSSKPWIEEEVSFTLATMSCPA